MIFGDQLLPKVLDGTKTVTRRLPTPGKPRHYHPGLDYAVQPGRGKHAVARIEIVWAWVERLGTIKHYGPAEAHHEGFTDVNAYLDYWQALHGQVDLDARVWRIEFRLLAPPV